MTKKDSKDILKKENEALEDTRDRVLAEALIRISSLERLLLKKNIISEEELVEVIKGSVNEFQNEVEKAMLDLKDITDLSQEDINNIKN